jgi:hypothetical protein
VTRAPYNRWPNKRNTTRSYVTCTQLLKCTRTHIPCSHLCYRQSKLKALTGTCVTCLCFRDADVVVYSQAIVPISVYRVKPAVFDLLLAGGIAAYLFVVYTVVMVC